MVCSCGVVSKAAMCMYHEALAFWGEFWDRARALSFHWVGVVNSGECWLP